MNLIDLALDSYERKARLYPSLLLISPVILTAVAMVSTKLSALQSFTGVLVGCGGAFLLTQLARDIGKAREPKLFELWGGPPSVAVFRHRDSRIGKLTKARLHALLQSQVNGIQAPTAEEEAKNPVEADEVYLAWSDFIRAHTRDRKDYSVLFGENVNYGYRRNVWGLRSLGILLSSAGVLCSGVRAVDVYFRSTSVDLPLVGSGTFCLVLLILWVFRFTDAWVKVAADAYAVRLAECVEILAHKEKALST